MNFIILISVLVSYGFCDNDLNFPKCSIKDSKCQMNFFQTVGRTFSPTGIAQIGVPPLDPYHLKNITMPVMDMLYMTLDEGDCLGIGTCTVLEYETDLEKFHKSAEIICDRIVIEGSYTVLSDPFFSQYLGNVHGSGKGSIVLENWYIKLDYPFDFVKHEDGEIYIEIKSDEAVWESVVLNNITIAADNIMINDQDVTADTLAYLNEHWKTIQDAFGYSFHAISVGYYFEIYGKFFSSIPTSSYLSDDLSSYVMKD